MQRINPSSYQPSTQQHSITQATQPVLNGKLQPKHLLAMTKLWQLLTDELGASFKNQFGLAGGHSFNHWARELSGFSESVLFSALEKFKASGSTFMSLNAFRAFCKPQASDLGITEFHAAMLLVIQRKWESLHPAFQHLAQGFDIYALQKANQEQAARLFKPLYQQVLERVAAGESFERVKAISNNTPKIGLPTEADKAAYQKAREAKWQEQDFYKKFNKTNNTGRKHEKAKNSRYSNHDPRRSSASS